MDLQLNAGNLTVSGAQVTDSSSLRTDAGNITANLSMTPKAALSVQVNAGNASLTLPAEYPCASRCAGERRLHQRHGLVDPRHALDSAQRSGKR